MQVKNLQARRFVGTYTDLLASGPYAEAAQFFLDELYSDKDYAERDAQFARIAGAIERFFPSQVVATAVALAELHALTEELDHAMAVASAGLEANTAGEAARYVAAWRTVGRRADREGQLAVVLDIGREMTKLTRTAGLRTLLKMMRAPAAAAGLSSLQRFLEHGFDTFAAMARRPAGAEAFLGLIASREKDLIRSLFDDELVACETDLARTLGQAR
ncbi:FFLEELY motif protein [Caenimonas koreensis]|uniref:FFLEELY motif protein n=1 Tax=Caenimonas koreensis TaxID=367474 RepID=UPI002B270A61|nr:hypothetical protein [Caenimonas koreensis]